MIGEFEFWQALMAAMLIVSGLVGILGSAWVLIDWARERLCQARRRPAARRGSRRLYRLKKSQWPPHGQAYLEAMEFGRRAGREWRARFEGAD